MRQNMLLESLGDCCGRMVSHKTQADKLAQGTCQQCLRGLESVCREQAEETRVRLQGDMAKLREEQAERERNLNTSLQQLLNQSHEENALLKRLEEGQGHRVVPSDSKMRHQPTQQPASFGTVFGLGSKPLSSVLKEQEVSSPLDLATMEKALVAIATELQRVHLQLSRVIEQAGTLRKDRGDT